MFIALPVGRGFRVQCSLLCQQAKILEFSVSQLCQQVEDSKLKVALFCQQAEDSKFKVHNSANRQKLQSSVFIILAIGRSFKIQCSQLCQQVDDSKLNVSQFYRQIGDLSPMFYSSINRQKIQSPYILYFCKQAIESKSYVARPRQLIEK